MNWKEEKAKLLLGHKLEKQRIYLNRALAGAGLVLVGMFAYIFAPQYASRFKEHEIRLSKETEIAKETELEFARRRLDAIKLVDSLYNATYISFRLGALGFGKDVIGENGIDSRSRLAEDVMRLGSVLRREKYYLGDEYWDRVHMRNQIFLSLVDHSELWNQKIIIDFVEWLSDDFVHFTAAEFARLTGSPPPKGPWPEYKLIQTEMPRSNVAEMKESSLNYLKTNVMAWGKFMDSLAAVSDSL